MTEALQVMNELKLVEDFPVDNITIFERRGSRWDVAVTMELGGDKVMEEREVKIHGIYKHFKNK